MKRALLLLLALLALPAAARNDGHAVYRPGLTQARIPFPSDYGYKTAYDGVPILASNLLANADASWLDRTLDVFKDGEHSNLATNPISGNTWPWLIEHNHGVFAYEGEIFVEEGVEYSFYGRANNGEALVVDGETVVWQGRSNGWQYGPEIRKRWTAPKTGWVPFNGWLWSWNGSYGTQWSEWSLQYNVQGVVVTFLDPSDRLSDRSESLNSWLAENRGLTNVWQRFADPGNGTFLRTVTTNRFTTVGASQAVADGRSFDLSFEGVPTNATLVAFSGPYDGGHATSEWVAVSAALAQVPAGDSTATVTVPLAADATVLRFRLATGSDIPADGIHPFEEWTEMLAVSASPVIRIDTATASYTNIVVAGSLGSFGLDASSATVTVQVATAADTTFATPVITTNLPAFNAVGAFEVGLFGLTTNTAYLVRATALNDRQVSGVSPVLPFRTAEPGPPTVSLAATLCTLATADLAATVSDWGGGSWNAEVWIDVSASDSFPAGETQTLSLGALSGHLPVSKTATATGLHMASNYFARARAANSWGIGNTSETISFATDNHPIRFPTTAPTTPAGGSVSVTLAPTFVTEGTVYDVLLSVRVNGEVKATPRWQNQTAVRDFSYRQIASAGSTVEFVYTIDWRYEADGLSGTITVEGSDESQLADTMLDGLAQLDSLYLRPGDTVGITPSENARIDWHTNAVLSTHYVGNVFLLEALEPGATLLYESGSNGSPNGNKAAAIVLPAEDPPGGVYVHRGFEDWTWTDPYQWTNVVEGPLGYPNAVGAVAYVVEPQITDSKSHDIEVPEPITLGSLFIGQLGWIHHGYNTKTEFFTQLVDTSDSGGSLRFETGNGSTSTLGMLGHCYVASPVKIQVPVSAANNLDVDELDRIPDSDGWRDWRDHGLKFNRPVDLGPHTFRTRRGHYYPGRINAYERGFLTFTDDIIGTGLIRFEADSIAGMQDGSDAARLKSFFGVWDIANGQYGKNGVAMGGAGLNFVRASLGNASELIVRGNWHMADASWNAGAFVRSGYDEGAWTNDWNDAVPPKVTLDGAWLRLETPGGAMNADAKASYQATGIRRAYFRVRDFVVPAGPQGRLETGKSGNSVDYPDNVVEITNLVMDANAVLSFTLGDSGTIVTNDVRILETPANLFTNIVTGEEFIPYFFANYEADNNNQLIFRNPSTGGLSKRTAGTGETDLFRRWTAAATIGNDEEYAAMLLAANVTISFEEGATVTNLAGYLDLRGGAAVGRVGADAGVTLDFGSQPARIYVGKRADTATVGCKLTGSAGLVKGGSGVLALGASAEGVAGGVRVAGGTLALGAVVNGTNHVGRIAGNVRIEAGSRLVVRGGASFASGVRLHLNDRDWIPSFAHVRLEANAEIARLLVNGEPMPNGYYGSSEASIAHPTVDVIVDDVHFEGPGVLWAGVRPTMLILK